MIVTIYADNLASWSDDGSVVRAIGLDSAGNTVTFGIEPRYAQDIGQALIFGDEESVDVEVEDWQVIGVQPMASPAEGRQI